MTTLYLCGAGNSEGVRLALSINQKERRWHEVVLLDDDDARHGQSLLSVEIRGSFGMLAKAEPESTEVANLVARTTVKRLAARRKIAEYGLPFATLTTPGLDLTGVEIGEEITIYPNATVSPEVSIGDASVIFMGAVVGHESQVGSCCVVASGAVLNARVRLGDGVYVGSNATILPEVTVGPWATIGAGSTVIEDVPAGATAMGVPAQILVSPEPRSDKKSDSAPVASLVSRGAPDPMSRQQLEKTIATIWGEILEQKQVSPRVNFFDLGGTSLLAMKVQQRIQQATQVEVALTDLFRFPTIEALARHMAALNGNRSVPLSHERAEARRTSWERRRQVRKSAR